MLFDFNMTNNALYHVISKQFFDIRTMINEVTLVCLNHKQGNDYFLFQLSLSHTVMIGDYQLMNHHISVYEGPLSKQDQNSQYHYTAYFKDNANKKYRLHVYYDQKDDVVGPISFCLCVNDSLFQPIHIEEKEQSLIELATESSRDLMVVLRQQQAHLIEEHQNQYDKLALMLNELSKDLQKNREAYLQLIEKQLSTLESLKNFSNANQYYIAVIKYLKQIQASLLSEDTVLTEAHQKVISNTMEQSSDSPVFNDTVAERFFLEGVPPQQPLLQTISNELEQFTRSFNALTKRTDDKVVPDTLELISNARQSLGLIAFDYVKVVGKEKESLQALCNKLEKFAENLLKQLLLQEKFDQVLLMGSFFHTIPPQIFFLALMNDKLNLLEFLLKNKIFNVQYPDIEIKHVKYRSPVDYCFKHCSPKSSKFGVLSVLFKHGASLMEVDESTHWPFAAILLMDKAHPYHELLKKNAQKTLENPEFFKQLNHILQGLVLKQVGDHDYIEKTNALIQSTQEEFQLLMNEKKLLKKTIGTLIDDVTPPSLSFSFAATDENVADHELGVQAGREVGKQLGRALVNGFFNGLHSRPGKNNKESTMECKMQ